MRGASYCDGDGVVGRASAASRHRHQGRWHELPHGRTLRPSPTAAAQGADSQTPKKIGKSHKRVNEIPTYNLD